VPLTPAYSGIGRPPSPRYPDKPVDLRTLVIHAGRAASRYVVWRHGSRASAGNRTARMRSRFLVLRVRPANHHIPRSKDGTCPSAG
jgi:hypothetical protein